MGLRNKFLGLMGAALVSSMALSAQAEDTGGPERIAEIRAFGTKVDINMTTETHACTSTSLKKRFVLKTTAANYESLYTLALAAYLSGKPVTLQYTCGDDGFPSVVAVRVY